MMTEPVPLYEEVLEKYPGLFDNDAEWQALVADPTHELVPVPPPSFSELLDSLMVKLPRDVVETTAVSVINERVWIERGEAGDGDEGNRPADDAAGPEPAGDDVVADDGEPGEVGPEGGAEPARGRDPVSGDGADGAD